jgi:hypothetical protein
LAAALVLVVLLQARGSFRPETIMVTPETLEALEEERTQLLGRPLTDAERERLREDWIDQEVLVREAYRQGLDRGDGVIRHRLVEKMRVLLREKPREPTRAELEAFHREQPERYRSPERLSLDHVLFWKSAREEIPVRLAALRAGADFRKMGERFWLGPTLRGVSEAELGRVLGGGFAKEVFALEPGAWTGPIESIRGLHLVRATERRPPELARFEEVENVVRQDWFEEREHEALRARLVELKRRYRVEAPSARARPEDG